MRCENTFANVIETVCPVTFESCFAPFFVEGQEEK